ncbi:MAG: S-adenosylmethionine:tRNA ribosyltransferase-isomerase [Bacteroidetes bacterium]|nr:S-adenosylmethionine:tRNA ribosyltransferase-isomerase [Bacteroidota bacterium]
MITGNEINLEDYNYDLPEDRIAQFPLAQRDESKLLVFNNEGIKESVFSNVADFIPHGSFLVFNNTKVINARLFFKKKTGAKIEIFCLEPADNMTVEVAFAKHDASEWNCLVGNASKWYGEILEKKIDVNGDECILYAEKLSNDRGNFRIKFTWSRNDLPFSEVIHNAGLIPLPPYIKRKPENGDSDRYQTVYADVEGSVAAPTAGLHFTKEVLSGITNRGIDTGSITLNVGAGTFRPIKAKNVLEHEMHYESFTVSRDFLRKLYNEAGKKIVAVGTTSVRTLESLYWISALNKHEENFVLKQWEVYDAPEEGLPDLKTALKKLIDYLDNNNEHYITASTGIMIVPGYKFRVVDVLITNFHMPCSSLLLLVSAFTGSAWKRIYKYALDKDFRFLSYGDSSILFKQQ